MTENKESTVDRSHAILGGSGAERWVNCPGSVFLTKDLPEEPSGPHAIEGTIAHDVAEKELTDWLNHKLEGTTTSRMYAVAGANQDMYDFAKEYTDTIWKNVLENSITGKAFGFEDKFTLDAQLGMSGYLDFWVVYIDDRGKRVGVIVDYKYGFNRVEAEKNYQLAFYACAMRKEIRAAGKDLDYVRAVIFQPRIEGESYSETKFTGKQLDKWEETFFKAATQIFVKQKPKFKVGDWCKYCKGKAICPSYKKVMEDKTSLQLVDISEPLTAQVAQIPDDVIRKVLLNKDMIESFLKACSAHVINRHKLGKPIEGLKVVAGSSRRTWVDDTEGVQKDLEGYGVKNAVAEPKLKGITVIEKELAKLHGKDKAKQILGCHTKLSMPSLCIVSVDDPREPIKELKDMFGEDE